MTTHAAPPRPTVRPELAGIRTHQVFDGVDSYFEVPYAVMPGFRPLVLDLHVPRLNRGPIVVYAHGGGFDAGRVIGFGSSAGGYLVNAVALAGAEHPDLVGVRAELIVVPGADHGAPEFDQKPMHDQTLEFLAST